MKPKPILIDKDEFFSLYILQPTYLELKCSDDSYWKNKITGENCGQRILLCVYKYNNDGSLKDHFEMEENCYELTRK